jgi:iron complex transport system substrate-binding protein
MPEVRLFSLSAAPRTGRAHRAGALATAAVIGAILVPTAADAAAPKRVVALSPFVANTLADLSVKPIAVGSPIGSSYRLSPRLNGVKRLVLTHPNGPNLENLISLKPDLVLSSPNWRQGTNQIRKSGIAVDDAIDPQRLNTVSAATRKLSERFGKQALGKRLVAKINRDIKAARKGIKSQPTVLLVLGVGSSTSAFLPNSWGGDIVKNAGGKLLTDGMKGTSISGTPGSFAPLSDEQVVAKNPDVIIAVPHGTPSSIEQTKQNMKNRAGWKNTSAARNNRIYISDPDTLLQASTTPGASISKVRREYLKN